MAKKQPSKTDDDSSTTTPATFEESLAELQEVVADLESGETGLERSMERFEQGIALLRNCYQTLERAEQQIEILTGIDADGNPMTEPFDASKTATDTSRSAGKRRRPKPRTTTSRPDDRDEDGGGTATSNVLFS